MSENWKGHHYLHVPAIWQCVGCGRSEAQGAIADGLHCLACNEPSFFIIVNGQTVERQKGAFDADIAQQAKELKEQS